jgi:hypothetical protein
MTRLAKQASRLFALASISASLLMVGASGSAAIAAPAPAPVPAPTMLMVDQPLDQFISTFWAAQFGVAYSPGHSGVVLSISSLVIDGIGDVTDPALLTPETIDLLDTLLPGQVTRVWQASAVDTGLPVGQQTVVTGSFHEDSRSIIADLTPTAEELAAGGLSSFSHFAVSGEFVGSTGLSQNTYGLLVEIGRVDGAGSVAFVPLGVAADAPAAALAASAALALSDAALIQQQPVVQPGQRDCAREHQLCYDAAYARYTACRKTVLAGTVACIAACALGCIAAGPFYPICLAACGASCIAAEALLLSACNDTLTADRLDCDRARLECDRANRAALPAVPVVR